MKVIVCYSAGHVETLVMRGLVDDERRLILAVPWSQPPSTTLAAVRDRLTDEEAAEVARLFGLGRPGGAS
jgi:hypothetical protein